MSKFANPTPPVISTWSRYTSLFDYYVQGAGAGLAQASMTWVANIINYVPLYLPFQYPVKRVFWINGASAGGTHQVGVYSWEGVALYRSALTTGSGNSLPQYVSCDFLLDAGSYYMAYWHDTSSANRTFGHGSLTIIRSRQVGLAQESSASGLPSVATFATLVENNLAHYGITRLPSGF